MRRQQKNAYLVYFLLSAFMYSYSSVSYSYNIYATDSTTHYRLTIEKANKPIELIKVSDKIILRGDNSVSNDLLTWFRQNKFSKKYIKSVELSKSGELNIFTVNPYIEAFSFLRNSDKNLIIDFWENSEQKKKIINDSVSVRKAGRKKNKAIKKVKPKTNVKKKKVDTNYLDFRYGLNFIWEYEPMYPGFNKFVEIKRKTPLYFYKIKSRDYDKSESEAHMQLTINLFEKDKWGLMNKSVDLYKKKYGADKNEALNEFLRIVALIKNNYLSGETTPKKEVIKRLEELERISTEFQLSKAILKYVFQYYIETNDYISSLKVGKRLFVLTKEDYDTEGLVESLHGIIYSLSQLNQYSKIYNLLEDKEVEKYLDKIEISEYKIYNLLLSRKYSEVLNEHSKIKKSILGKIPASILFNVAESLFGLGKYDESTKLFDKFLKSYSYDKRSSHARLRIALGYDLLGMDKKVVSRLYKDSIDRSSNPEIRYEAYLRYFGFEYLRNERQRNEELIAFIDPPIEIENKLSKNLLKAKWQMRFRSYIVREAYDKSLIYLKNIPLKDLTLEDRIVFERDGAAALTYRMNELFRDKKYAELIQVHEEINGTWTDRQTYYIKRNELLGMAYHHMNIINSYQKVMNTLSENKGMKTEYPKWKKMINLENKDLSLFKLFFLSEIKKESYDKAELVCKKIENINGLEGAFCQGKTNFLRRKFDVSKKYFEKIVSEYDAEIKDTDFSQEVSYFYLLSLYKGHYTDRFVEIINNMILSNSFDGMSNPHEEELLYLYYETLYSVEKYPINKLAIKSMENFYMKFEKSKWRDRVRYLRASSLIKLGNVKKGREELDSLISTSKKEYIKDLARSELASLILNNKNI